MTIDNPEVLFNSEWVEQSPTGLVLKEGAPPEIAKLYNEVMFEATGSLRNQNVADPLPR